MIRESKQARKGKKWPFIAGGAVAATAVAVVIALSGSTSATADDTQSIAAKAGSIAQTVV